MEEIFDTYKKRTNAYIIISCIIAGYIVCFFTGLLFPKVMREIPDSLIVWIFLFSLLIIIAPMFLGISSMKTYIKDGQLILTESSLSINGQTYPLSELLSAETNANDYRGKITRSGYSDGTNNRIIVTTKDHVIIKAKFVTSCENQKDNVTQLLKHWRSIGFKIISNDIDLI